MDAPETGTLLKLSQLDETVASADDDVRGRDVRDKNGDEIGRVKDLLVDHAENRVRFLEVASGGFLGIGQDTSLIPVDAVTDITEDEVRIDLTREHLAGAPAYDPELVRQRDDYAGFLRTTATGPGGEPTIVTQTIPTFARTGFTSRSEATCRPRGEQASPALLQ